MSIIKTSKQKDNFAKFIYDLAKIIFAIAVISPVVKPESFSILTLITGTIVTLILFITAYSLDGMEVKL
ncbi:MAG: DUF6722 family protein [Bacteroidota bacterium]